VSVPPLPPPEGEEAVEVKGPGEHVFIPFVKEIVPVVDLARGVAGGYSY
jgi:ribosomal 30S subunit maturation factor RimM